MGYWGKLGELGNYVGLVSFELVFFEFPQAGETAGHRLGLLPTEMWVGGVGVGRDRDVVRAMYSQPITTSAYLIGSHLLHWKHDTVDDLRPVTAPACVSRAEVSWEK